MPSGVTDSPSSVVARQLLPDQVVGVVLPEPTGLAQDRGGRRLPRGAVVVVRGVGQRERALVGLELGGLGQPALDGLL